MRFQSFLLPALVSAAVLENRQLGTTLKVVKIDKLEPEVNDNAVAQITKFGPITVKAKMARLTAANKILFSLSRMVSAKTALF